MLSFVNDNFIAVAGDDWYQRRRRDAEGDFFRSIAEQGPRKGKGGATRQGLYIFTAAGKLLAYNNHQDAASVYAFLRQGYFSWRRRPLEEREPGAVKIADAGRVDKNYHHEPPPGGLVLNVYTRILERTAGGELCPGTCKFPGGQRAAHDHLWLTEKEWRSLIPSNAKTGDTLTVPEGVALRIARFHLLDNTRGEPPRWRRREVHAGGLKLTVTEVTPQSVNLRLDGAFLLADAADALRAERGYDVRLLGHLRYDLAGKAITRFDVLAVGDHWGEGTYTPEARPGRTPLGIVFELARPDVPADRVPPHAARDWQEYMQAER